jgi:hypothetical protein
MKPNVVSATIQPTGPSLTALPTAKIVRHPRSKMEAGKTPAPPDEETLHRLNLLAKQLFCRLHKGSNSPLL